MKIIPKIENLQAMCKSPWRYFQNLFMGLGTGMVSTHTFSMGKIIGLLFEEKKQRYRLNELLNELLNERLRIETQIRLLVN